MAHTRRYRRPAAPPRPAPLHALSRLVLTAGAFVAAAGIGTARAPGDAPSYPTLTAPSRTPDPAAEVPEEAHDSQVLRAWDSQAEDWFGYAMALDGERLMVGIPYDDLAGANSGSVAAFEYGAEGWQQRDILAPANGGRGDYFGMAVALDGTRCVVGAPWNNGRATYAGVAYVFEWDGKYWNQRARLYAEDARAGDHFGVSVAIDGDRIVVGSRWSGVESQRTGAVYVYELQRGEWSQTARLVAAESRAGGEFGFRIDLERNTIAVGAYAANDDRGEVFVFDLIEAQWRETVRLTAPVPAAGDCFGLALSLSGEELLVGAPWRDDAGPDSGAAYLFRRGRRAWTLRETWTAPEARGGEYFGCSVALAPKFVVVGARYGCREVPRSGAVFFASRAGGRWNPQGMLPRVVPTREDAFGLALALDDLSVVVGARELDPDGTRNGSGSCRWYSLETRK